MRTFLLVLLLSLNAHSFEPEELFPDNHPSRLGVVTTLFSSLQTSLWQWTRDGVAIDRGPCLHWYHSGAGWSSWTATCLNVSGTKHVLSFFGDYIDEKFEFIAREGVTWTLEELLSFDAVSIAPDLVRFSSMKTGNTFDYKEGVLHFRTKKLGGYEFFAVTTPWQGGYRQEVYGRCPTCSAKRYRAYLYANERLEYRASNVAGEITPRLWNEFMSGAYTYALDLMAVELDFFTPDAD